MSNLKLDLKKLEQNINKKITKTKQRQLNIKHSMGGSCENMKILPSKEEQLLEIILSKYNGNEQMQVQGNWEDITENLKIGIKDTFNTLYVCNYIGKSCVYLSGNWWTVVNPEGIRYFEKKGMRKELFEELADNEKELLKQIIDTETTGGNISELLANKVNSDKNDLQRSIICSLKRNGLINVSWADNTVYCASLANAGRTYFEREEKFLNKMKENSSNTYNIGSIQADGGNVVIGDVINSSLNIDKSVVRIENRIEQECDQEDKQEIKDLLEEAKEIAENIKRSQSIGQRKIFFKRLTDHACKYGWLYAEIVNLLGTVTIGIIGGK